MPLRRQRRWRRSPTLGSRLRCCLRRWRSRALSLSRRRPALVGFDDFDFAPLLSPPVTVVSYDPVELGRQAARLICERLDGESGPPRQIVVPTELVARGSGEGGLQREQGL